MKKRLCFFLAVILTVLCSVNISAASYSCSGHFHSLIEDVRCSMGYVLCDVSVTLYYTAIDGVQSSSYHSEYEYHHGAIELYNLCPYETSIASV